MHKHLIKIACNSAVFNLKQFTHTYITFYSKYIKCI